MQGNPNTNVKVVQHTQTTAATGTTTPSNGVDCRGYSELLVIIGSGTFSGDESVTWALQESSDDGAVDTFAAITGAAFTAVTTANDEARQVGRVSLHGRERYIRAVGTSTGSGASTNVVTFVLLGAKDTDAQNTDTYVFSV